MNAQRASAVFAAVLILPLAAAMAQGGGCADGARLLRSACDYDLKEVFHVAQALCHDSSEADPECFAEAAAVYDEDRVELITYTPGG